MMNAILLIFVILAATFIASGVNTENIRGSGLGLYICRQLMHKMSGEIFAGIDGKFITVTVVFVRG